MATTDIDNKKTARIAGFWYLMLGIGAGYSWIYITKIFAVGNATLTAENLLQSETQYITALIFSIIGQISFVFLGLVLYRLLKQVNESQAKTMLTLVLVSVPIMFVNIILQTGALVVLNRADYLNVFSTEQIYSIAMTFLDLSITGVHIVEIFWGLWLFPLAWLIYKSNFLPKILTYLLVLSGICYLMGSLSYLINPTFFALIGTFLSIPESIGELAIVFWLLIKGVSIKNINKI
jgi:hypothetical protein